MKKFLLLNLIGLGVFSYAQNINLGNFQGGLESNSQWYQADDELGFEPEQEQFRANNYFRLDYQQGKISAGLQYEAYLPKPLLGYSDALDGNGIATYYARYNADNLDVTAGYFYDQFGSGLIYRSWEDRQIGINNALRGLRVAYTPNDYSTIKGIIGNQRRGFELTDGTVQGLDAEVDVLRAINPENATGNSFKVGASYVGKYEAYSGPLDNLPTTVNNYSVRADYISKTGITTGFEYVLKGEDALILGSSPSDKLYDGNAFLFNLGFSKRGFGINTTFRRLENMGMYSERNLSEAITNPYNEGNINFLPALTRQHDYLLTNIYVYQSQGRLDFLTKQAGEIGGQVDVYYNLKKGSMLGGKYGTKLALNASYWNGLNARFDNDSYQTDFFDFGKKFFHDVNIEMTKKWSPKLSSIFTYVHAYYDKGIIEGGDYSHIISNTVVGDFLYKVNARNSLRLELQHLQSKRERKNWAAAVLEYNRNFKWSYYVSDMYNYGNDNKDDRFHYYNIGGAYTKGSLRFAANYGRQRGGLICVGGVCRYVPENTGLSLSLQKTF